MNVGVILALAVTGLVLSLISLKLSKNDDLNGCLIVVVVSIIVMGSIALIGHSFQQSDTQRSITNISSEEG